MTLCNKHSRCILILNTWICQPTSAVWPGPATVISDHCEDSGLYPNSKSSKHHRSASASFLGWTSSCLWGPPANQLNLLQNIQNAAARIVTRTDSRQHILISVLLSLHWLPTSKRIEYRILSLTYQCVHEIAPQKLQELASHKIDLVLSAPVPSAD